MSEYVVFGKTVICLHKKNLRNGTSPLTTVTVNRRPAEADRRDRSTMQKQLRLMFSAHCSCLHHFLEPLEGANFDFVVRRFGRDVTEFTGFKGVCNVLSGGCLFDAFLFDLDQAG